ncbi:MAG TPA: IS200/IS605 family transposase [Candidatus Methanoperedens sp.]|nr:IS200/IS605 family transposase [Candidatus Methanoperedens sp.]
MQYKHSRNKVFLINYHLIWCPKRRKKVLVGEIKTRLEQIINEVAKEKNTEILALEVMPDHLHLFVSSHPNILVHNLIKAFKARSSNLLRKEYPELLKLPSLWTHSYFISTERNVSSKTIKKYIEAQNTR